MRILQLNKVLPIAEILLTLPGLFTLLTELMSQKNIEYSRKSKPSLHSEYQLPINLTFPDVEIGMCE